MIAMLLACAAFAQSGFSGVGGPDQAPGFGEVGEESVDPEVAAEVLRREKELLQLVRETDPRLHQRLVRLSKTNRRAYVLAMVRVARTVQRARTDPEYRRRLQAMRALSSRLEDLAVDHRAAPVRKQPAIEQEMKKVASDLMDLRQADRRERLEQMKARLQELQDEIDRRESRRQAIIDAYVRRMLERPEDL